MSRKKKPSTVQPVLLSVRDVSVQLGVCPSTVYKLINEKGLPSLLLRGTRKIHPDSLHTWLKEQERQSA